MIPSTTIRHTPARDLRGEDWRSHAACLDHDPELFYARGDWSGNERQRDAALAVCASCPVVAECLAWAMTRDGWDDHGILGGTTPDQRRAMRRRAARSKQ